MNSTLRFLLIATLLVITAHRLPAPIQEVESPTTTSPEQTRPKKNSAKPKAKAPESEAAPKTQARSSSTAAAAPQGAARFAGTWTGTITQPTSTSKVTLVFNATATSVTLAGRERPATVNGNTISWRSGMFNGNAWTLTPNNDGKTAQATVYSGALGQWSATFNRDQVSQPSTKKPGP